MENNQEPSYTEQEIGDEPPDVSILGIISTFRTRGFIDTINDDILGPHVHLFLLLSIVFVITIFIGIASLAF
jgi:hypothetical protein